MDEYTRCLESGQVGGDEAVASMDDQLTEPTILVFRRLAHAKARSGARRPRAPCHHTQQVCRCMGCLACRPACAAGRAFSSRQLSWS